MSAAGASTPLVLDIDGWTHDGRGVGRVAGKAVFVGGALPGEQVRARIVRRHARFDEAETIELLRIASERTAPRCPHFGRCGGCALQHLEPDAQLAAHAERLAETLRRIGGLHPAHWRDPVASPAFGYRSRARLAVAPARRGEAARLGFRRDASHAVEPLDECPILVPELARLIAPFGTLVGGLRAARELREILLAAGEPGVALAAAWSPAAAAADREALQDWGQREGVAIRHGVAGTGATLWPDGAPALAYAAGADGPAIAFQPWHFTQANRAVNRALIGAVLEELAPAPGERVLDLFCGLGNFSLPLAARGARVTGLEGDPAMVELAGHNARRNGLDGCEFRCADLARDPRGAAWTREEHELVLLDPPRRGATELIPQLARTRARRIVYVSCDAATLARDAATLCAPGRWRIARAGVFDMFPQTTHFESLVVFERAV